MIENAYRDLREALAEHSPDYADFLPPATAAEIETAAAYFDIPPTSDLLTWWRLTAGTTTNFINYYRLLGPLETIEVTRWFRDVRDQPDMGDAYNPRVGWGTSWVVFGHTRDPLLVDAGRGGDDTIWFSPADGNVHLPGTIATVLDLWTQTLHKKQWTYDADQQLWHHGDDYRSPLEIWRDRLAP